MEGSGWSFPLRRGGEGRLAYMPGWSEGKLPFACLPSPPAGEYIHSTVAIAAVILQ